MPRKPSKPKSSSLFVDPESLNLNAFTPEHLAAFKSALEADRANPSNPDDFDDSDDLEDPDNSDEPEDEDDHELLSFRAAEREISRESSPSPNPADSYQPTPQPQPNEPDDSDDDLTDDELSALHPATPSWNSPQANSERSGEARPTQSLNQSSPDPSPVWNNAALDARIDKRVNDRFSVAPSWGGNIRPLTFHPWLVENIAQSGHITLVVGDSAAKKTYAMLHLALHVSLGLPWLNHPTLQTPVLYMDDDHGKLALNHRITLLARGIRRQTPPPIYIATQNGWQFPDHEDAYLLGELIHRLKTRLVIMDPFFKLSPYNLESASLALTRTIDMLRDLAETRKTAIILVHHVNKRGLYRGVSHLLNLVDNVLFMHSQPNSPQIVFENHKLRDTAARSFAARMLVHPPGPAPYYVEFHPHALTQTAGFSPLGFGRLPPARPTTAAEAILRHLAIHGPASRHDLVALIPGQKPHAVHRALTRLRQSGEVLMTPGAPATYAIPAKQSHD